MKDNNEYTKEQQFRLQQKMRKQMKQHYLNKQKKKDNKKFLEDRNPLKLRSLDSSCPCFQSDNNIWGQ